MRVFYRKPLRRFFSCLGVTPNQFLKERLNADCSENPSTEAIWLIDAFESAKYCNNSCCLSLSRICSKLVPLHPIYVVSFKDASQAYFQYLFY
jgi:hypothetical protein